MGFFPASVYTISMKKLASIWTLALLTLVLVRPAEASFFDRKKPKTEPPASKAAERVAPTTVEPSAPKTVETPAVIERDPEESNAPGDEDGVSVAAPTPAVAPAPAQIVYEKPKPKTGPAQTPAPAAHNPSPPVAGEAFFRWTVAPGKISDVRFGEPKNGEPRRGIIAYEYSVDGQPYRYETFRWIHDDKAADAFKSAYKPGAFIEVYYDPRDPGRSYVVKANPK